MKKITKKMIPILSLCVALVPSSMHVDALEEHLDPNYFMNISFEIPEGWEYSSENSNETTAIYQFIYNDEIMLIQSSHYEDEYNNLAASLYDSLVGTLASSFSDYDNYYLINSIDYDINGCTAQYCIFTCDINTVFCYLEDTSVNTGYEVVDFLYLHDMSTSDEGLGYYGDMIEAIEVGKPNASEESTSSSDDISTLTTQYDDGIYEVGADIPAGEYVVFADEGENGFFNITSDFLQQDSLCSGLFDYNSIITINDSEYLYLGKCYAVPISEDPDVDVTGTGMFLVGTHIPAGEYELDSGDEMGHYTIYSNSRKDDIITQDNFVGQGYVTVSDGQYLELSRCSLTDPPQKFMKTYTDSETVMAVQEALNNAGYDCGTPDGAAGSSTASAIENYQTDNNLSVTGTITDELLDTLKIQ